ncbi:MAG: Mut7-C RNAse domain-containing protein [Thaumarchaeota archaeon]|nr:Mut7-C RNAse domain-containing protein [Nitrososphaerota archaeon]
MAKRGARAPRSEFSVKRPLLFVADAMLGSLARKLRIFGFDTIYFGEGGDPELEALAKKEKRVIITSDRRLFEHSEGMGLRAVLVEGKTDGARLRSVAKQAGPGMTLSLRGRTSRCAVCNGELELIRRSDAAASEIPPKVLARHRLFFVCKSCSRRYWRGRHWDKLRRLSYSLDTKDLT